MTILTGGIKSSEENRAQDAACSWKTGEYLDAYGKPTGERFITTERISARFDSNYVNDADGSACVRYIVCSDDDCICIRLFKYGKYPVTNAGSTTKYYIIFFTDTEGKRHMLEGYALPGGSEIYLDNTYQYPYDAGDGFVTDKMLVKNKLLKDGTVRFTVLERCRPFTTFEFGVESVGFVEAKGKVMGRR